MPEADDKLLLCKDEVHAVIGCAFNVLNTLGRALLEKPYENALAVEFGLQHVPFPRQTRYEVFSQGNICRKPYHDLVALSQIVVNTNAIGRVPDVERAQAFHDSRKTGLKTGLSLSFRYPKLEWIRLASHFYLRSFVAVRGSKHASTAASI